MTTKAPSITATAERILTEAQKTVRDYEEYANEYAAKGMIPERCVHGAYLWVDHDIPCGACEEGDNPANVTPEVARDYAEGLICRYNHAVVAHLGNMRHIVTIYKDAGVGVDKEAANWFTRDTRRTVERTASYIVFA